MIDGIVSDNNNKHFDSVELHSNLHVHIPIMTSWIELR